MLTTGPVNFFPVENTLPSPTGTVCKSNNVEEGWAEVALSNCGPLDEVQWGHGLLEFAPSAGPTPQRWAHNRAEQGLAMG